MGREEKGATQKRWTNAAVAPQELGGWFRRLGLDPGEGLDSTRLRAAYRRARSSAAARWVTEHVCRGPGPKRGGG